MVETRGLQETIAALPLFKSLTDRDLELITGCASNVRFEAGAKIFREGDDADRFFAIRHGTIALEIYAPERGGMTVETVGAGGVLGWAWIFPPHKRLFDAKAVSLVRAIAFDGACLRGKCEEDPRLGYELMKRFARVMVQRLQAMSLRLMDLYGDSGRG